MRVQAAQEAAELFYIFLEYFCHIVIKLFPERRSMHRYDGAASPGLGIVDLLFNKNEVRDGSGVVVFNRVGVQAYELAVPGHEREIFRAKHVAVNLIAVAQHIVVSDEGDERHIELAHNIVHPFEFFGDSKIADITAVNDEINISQAVYMSYHVLGVVVFTLGVPGQDKAKGGLFRTNALDAFDVFAVCFRYSSGPAVIGVIIDHVAGRTKQQTQAD